MPSIIVGTAGHIDHGKTSLIRALTGVDTDRLPEEKRRGITIDLGFAELRMAGLSIGFVDVPGHERFIKNMLAGAHGIDAVALVIAADEGVMPQTREHFQICRLLGVSSGLVVLTKADLVDEDLLLLVRAEAEELVAGSFLEGTALVTVSARTGTGLDELKSALLELAGKPSGRSEQCVARLPIDRAFSMRGFGAVVTGTLAGGDIREGEEMDLFPAGTRVRVRGIQVHNRTAPEAFAGQRTALNLAGVESAQLERGMTLSPAERLSVSQAIDARVEVLRSSPRALRSRARVRVHLGTAELLARVQVLEEEGEISPGSRGYLQLRLESAAVALPGDHFIIRSYSPLTTVGGGVVVDGMAVRYRGRERIAVRRRLEALAISGNSERLALFISLAGEGGLTRSDLAARTGWRDEVLEKALTETVESREVIEAEGVFIARQTMENLQSRALAEVEAHHRREPLARGMPRELLRERVFPRLPTEVFRELLGRAEASSALVSERDLVRASSHSLELSPADKKLTDSLEQVFLRAGMEAPSLDEAINRAEIQTAQRDRARKLLYKMIDAGTLVRVQQNIHVHQAHLDDLIVKLREYASGHEPDRLIDVAAFKQLAGVSRKYAIPLLEYLDRVHVTKRAGDRRIIL